MAGKAGTMARAGQGKLPFAARRMFDTIAREYATASDQEWDELRAHLDEKVEVMAPASDPARREVVYGEFDRIREQVRGQRRGQLVLEALAGGAAELVRTRPDGLELWQVTPADGSAPVSFFVPAAEDGPAAAAARAALLAGRCPACKRQAVVVGDSVDVPHNSRCIARAWEA